MSYHIVSQRYEGKDIGFTVDEISELLNRKKDPVARVLDYRENLEAHIIGCLNDLFQTDDISTPYLTKPVEEYAPTDA